MDHLTKDLFICKNCSLISSDIKPDVTLYDKSYCRKYERYANTKLGKEIMDFRLDCVSNAYTHTTLLDFGCGTGEFHRSYDGEGFDINPFSEYCDVSPLLYSHMIVTFWDSIEHLKDPVRIIKGLNPKFIFISTPCYDDFVNGGDIHNITGWHHYYPGEHVHYFNEVSLRALLHKCGYNVFYKSFQESEYRQSGGDKNIITIGGRRG